MKDFDFHHRYLFYLIYLSMTRYSNAFQPDNAATASSSSFPSRPSTPHFRAKTSLPMISRFDRQPPSSVIDALARRMTPSSDDYMLFASRLRGLIRAAAAAAVATMPIMPPALTPPPPIIDCRLLPIYHDERSTPRPSRISFSRLH